jgi:hypothetical protein
MLAGAITLEVPKETVAVLREAFEPKLSEIGLK